MPVTGCSSSAGTCSVGGSGSSPSPSGTHASMSVMCPVRSARQRGATREPIADRVGAAAVDHVQHRGVGAVGPDQRERERLGRACACPARGSATHVNVCTVPRGPTSIQWSPSGATGRARRRVVLGRRHEHAAVGEPHRHDAAVAQAGEEAADHGPDRAGVPARVLEHVVGRTSGSVIASPRRRCVEPGEAEAQRIRSRGRDLPSTGRAACASTACRWARAAARRRSRCCAATCTSRAARWTCSMIDARSASSPATPGSGCDDGLDLLAHVVVGDAEHRDVGDLRVLVDAPSISAG